MNEALIFGIEFLNSLGEDSNRRKVIFFLTDGRASVGVKDPTVILRNVKNHNHHLITIHGVAFGYGSDIDFIEKLVIQNNGISRRVYKYMDAETQLKRFFDEISHATLKNLTFNYGDDVYDISKKNFTSYLANSEIVVVGRLAQLDINSLVLSVKGSGVQGSLELSLTTNLINKVTANMPISQEHNDLLNLPEQIWAFLKFEQFSRMSMGETNETKVSDFKRHSFDIATKVRHNLFYILPHQALFKLLI